MRKFRVLVIAQGMLTGIQEYSAPPKTTLADLIEHVQAILPAAGIPLSESDFQAFAYNQGRWLPKDETLDDIPSEEDTIVLVGNLQIQTLGNSIALFRAIADGILRQWTRPEDEILRILNELKDGRDTEETLLEKANSIIQLQPNIAGIGINLNEIVKRVLGKK